VPTVPKPVELAVLIAALAACGARSGTLDDGADAGADTGPACLPREVRGVVGRVGEGWCTLAGIGSDGLMHTMRCTTRGAPPTTEFETCVWLVEGEERCTCTEGPDWSNTCPNGVPLCATWNRPFDFATDVVFEP
jgi:hypothetical protein